ELSERQHRAERRLASSLRTLERGTAVDEVASLIALVEVEHEARLRIRQHELLRWVRRRRQIPVRPAEHLEAELAHFSSFVRCAYGSGPGSNSGSGVSTTRRSRASAAGVNPSSVSSRPT